MAVYDEERLCLTVTGIKRMQELALLMNELRGDLSWLVLSTVCDNGSVQCIIDNVPLELQVQVRRELRGQFEAGHIAHVPR